MQTLIRFLRLGTLLVLLCGAPIPGEESPTNTAIVPVGKLENDFYDFYKRHEAILKIKGQINPEIVLIGDSITHLWGGEPNEPQGNRGAESWKSLFGERRVLNLGFGYDRTQNVLWRIDHGELDGLTPQTVVIHIGTNNFSGTKNARVNSPEEIAAGIQAVVECVRKKCSDTEIILMAIFPRGQAVDDPIRAKIADVNQRLSPLAKLPKVTLLDITEKLTEADGSITRETMSDFLHPAAKGYAIWAEALRSRLPK